VALSLRNVVKSQNCSIIAVKEQCAEDDIWTEER
jgi:hypothetical protein